MTPFTEMLVEELNEIILGDEKWSLGVPKNVTKEKKIFNDIYYLCEGSLFEGSVNVN